MPQLSVFVPLENSLFFFFFSLFYQVYKSSFSYEHKEKGERERRRLNENELKLPFLFFFGILFRRQQCDQNLATPFISTMKRKKGLSGHTDPRSEISLEGRDFCGQMVRKMEKGRGKKQQQRNEMEGRD